MIYSMTGYGRAAENVDGADAIIRTSAIKDDNPEIMRAKELGIPILERAEAWGILMEEFPEVICISGTHGKTSTKCGRVRQKRRRMPQPQKPQRNKLL